MPSPNLLIGSGETLTREIPGNTGGGGEKAFPYTMAQARARLVPQLKATIAAMRKVPIDAKPRGEAVALVTVHPAFLSKWQMPGKVFETAGLRGLGSRATQIFPERDARVRVAGQSAPAIRSVSWSSLAKAGAAALGATATAFNFIGQEAYARYLGHWGFNDGMLPLDTSNRVHYGYMAVFESIYSLLNGKVGAWFLLSVFIMGGIQIWVTSLMKKNPPGDTKMGKWLKRNADRLPRSLKSLFASFGISGLIVVALYYLVFIAFIALAAAPFIGEHAAGKWTEKKEADIQKGCQRDGKHSVCTELRRDGEVIGTGLILASSTTHIAYFDIATKRGRLIKFEDGELTGWMP